MSILLKISNSVGTLENHVITKGKLTHVKAQPKVNYEIVDDSGASPKRIITKRIGNDLQIMLEDATSPDITIEGYYEDSNSGGALIGQGADGQYYAYGVDVSASGGVASLGGEALPSAASVVESGGSWFSGLSNTALGGLGLLGLGVVGGGIAAASSGGSDNKSPAAATATAGGALVGEFDPATGIISGTNATPGSTVTATLPNGLETSSVVKPDGSYVLPPFAPIPTNGETISVHVGNKTTHVIVPDTTPMIGSYDETSGVISGQGATPGTTVTASLPDHTKVSALVKPDGSYSLPALEPKPSNGETITVVAGNETVTITSPEPQKSQYNPTTGVVSGTTEAISGSKVIATLPDGTTVTAVVKPDGSYVLPPFSLRQPMAK